MATKPVPKYVKLTDKLVRTFFKYPPIDFRIEKSVYK